MGEVKKSIKEQRKPVVHGSWNYLNIPNWKQDKSDHGPFEHKPKLDYLETEYVQVQAWMKTVDHEDV